MDFRSQRRIFANHISAIAVACYLVLAGMAPPTEAQVAKPIQIIAFGDSLMAGFGLKARDALPAQLERALKAKGHAVEIIGAAVSGDTTAAGLQRVDWAVPEGADAVIVGLGANDMLRGIDPTTARQNLDAIIIRIKAKGAEVLIAGMKAPRNWGDAYVREFESIFPALAQKHQLILYPFLLQDVALRPELNLDDGMHPNARGIAEIVRGMLSSVEQLIERVQRTRAAKG